LKLPVEEMGDGPHVNVAKRVKSLSLAVQEEDDDVDLRLSLETDTEKQAEQIRQMVQGLVAMVEFAKSMEETDEELQRVAEFMKDAKATVEGSTVRLRLRLPADVIDQVLREMD
jgi:hypothetical protein